MTRRWRPRPLIKTEDGGERETPDACSANEGSSGRGPDLWNVPHVKRLRPPSKPEARHTDVEGGHRKGLRVNRLMCTRMRARTTLL